MNIYENMIGLLRHYIQTDSENKTLKQKQNEIKKIEKNFNPQFCCIPGCKEEPINSHEISRGAFLNPLCNYENRVITIDHDFRGNVSQLNYKKESSKSATTFPGFCARHDKDLFSSFENGNFKIDDDFVQKQCFRTIAKEIFLLKRELFTLSEERKKADNEEWLPYIRTMARGQKKNLRRYRKAYLKIWNCIKSGKTSLTFKEYNLTHKELSFAKMRYSRMAYFPVSIFTFILIFNYNGVSKCVLATFDNCLSRLALDDIQIKPEVGNIELNGYLLQNKERFVFSEDYICSLHPADIHGLLENNKIIGNLFSPNFLN